MRASGGLSKNGAPRSRPQSAAVVVLVTPPVFALCFFP